MTKAMNMKSGEAKSTDEKGARSCRDEAWEDRLRTVGDARFVEVQWSGRDHPCWPLPRK
jgi:hypothetical protein